MAKDDSVNTIWASLGITKNLGNYESARIDAGARVVADADDVEAWEKLWNEIESQIERKLLEANEELES
jgi:hypothetical protein